MKDTNRIVGLLNALIGKGLLERNGFNLTSFPKRMVLLPFWYVLTLVFSVFDLLFLGEAMTFLLRVSSKSTRKLTHVELEKLEALRPNDRQFLGSITVIEDAWLSKLGCWLTRRKSLGLGVAKTVLFSRKIDTSLSSDLGWLIHELAHTLQYNYRGLIYIPEALIAQYFSGYDFGGKQSLDEQTVLKAFNPEQQAEIFRHLLLSNYPSPLQREIIHGKW